MKALKLTEQWIMLITESTLVVDRCCIVVGLQDFFNILRSCIEDLCSLRNLLNLFSEKRFNIWHCESMCWTVGEGCGLSGWWVGEISWDAVADFQDSSSTLAVSIIFDYFGEQWKKLVGKQYISHLSHWMSDMFKHYWNLQEYFRLVLLEESDLKGAPGREHICSLRVVSELFRTSSSWDRMSSLQNDSLIQSNCLPFDVFPL